MKTGGALLLSTFLAALCGSLVNGNGVCYDPDHALGAKSEASIIKDMQAIRQKGFTHVRTYISKFGNTEMAKIIRDQGMTLALGVPYGNPDYTEQLKSALAVANGGNVQYLFLGNENLRGSVPSDFIAEIRRVKALVPGGVKVGTVQRNTEILEKISGLSDLINACDAIGINIHPFFTGGQSSADKAITLTKDQWTKALGIAGDKLILTETGWPTQGSVAGNHGSTEFASSYFSAYNAWSAVPGDKRFYFQMFDQPTRSEDFEQAYGIFTKDNVDKFNVAMNPAPLPAPVAPVYTPPTSAPTAAPTSAPTTSVQTSAPTTSAPTTSAPTTSVQTSAPTSAPTSSAPGATSSAPGATLTPTSTPTSTPSAAQSATSSSTPTPTTVAGTPIPSSSNSTSQTSGSAVSGGVTHPVTHGSGSKGSSAIAGADGSPTSGTSGPSTAGGSDSTQTGGADSTQAGGAAAAPAATQAPIVSNGHGDPVIAGEADKTTSANAKSSGAAGATTVVFAVAAGCVAVVAAFGFIYHTRKKAAELEAMEAKESVAITPHGSCVL